MRVVLSEEARRNLADAAARGCDLLVEPEAYAVVRSLGIGVPDHYVVSGPEHVDRLDLPALGDRVVVKVISPALAHKSDVGGVAVVTATREAVRKSIERMQQQVGRALEREGRSAGDIAGFLVAELVPTKPEGELLLGLSWSREFGPVVTLAPGGTAAERMAEWLEDGRSALVLSPGLTTPAQLDAALARKVVLGSLLEPQRGQAPALEVESLRSVLGRALQLADAAIPEELGELEINPLVFTPRGPMALDALVRPGRGVPSVRPSPPAGAVRRLLEPSSVAVVGVSRQLNPGRRVVQRLRAAGFAGTVHIVKPGIDELEGYPCVPDLAALPEPVDLLVLAVAAPAATTALEQALERGRARAVLLIPGGFDESGEGQELAARVEGAVRRSREGADGGAVVNGGNCLGVRSAPGRLDTVFIPESKLPSPESETAALALLSQSGAFAIARESWLADLPPRYLVSVGNQIDLTLGDYLRALKEDPEVHVFGCYVEGFRDLDGRRFFEAAAEIRRSGRVVVLYRAGRTPVGASAAASHTAVVAGSERVTRELAAAAGVVWAESIEEFTDLLALFCRLRERPAPGGRLGALSNAGFECVALADGVGAADDALELAPFTPATRGGLEALLAERGLEGIVDVHNPLDLTPMLDDEGYERAATLLLDDESVDLAVIACVPLTGALETLAKGEGHEESVDCATSVAHRLGRLFQSSDKPWVAVVDSGRLYDPMVRVLEEHGLPVFRSADRAVDRLATFCRWHRR